MAHDLALLIGNKNLSSWSMRPWLVLEQAGISFEERVMPFETAGWRDQIVHLSPSRRVPALSDRGAGLVIWDSLAICEYVAELFPGANLWPRDSAARAIARAVTAEMHSGFAAMRRDLSMDVVARHGASPRGADADADIERIQAIWEDCRSRFGAGGPFLFGAFSIADAMYAPCVWRFRTYGVTLAGAARAYYETMLALPSMRRWEEDAEAEVRALAELRTSRASQTGPGAHRAPDPTSAQHCFAVIFSAQRAGASGNPTDDEYETTAARMVELARDQPGFLGIESARGADGFGITVSYWESPEAIQKWKSHPEHRAAQAKGRESFYERYEIRVCTVDRGYAFDRASPAGASVPAGK